MITLLYKLHFSIYLIYDDRTNDGAKFAKLMRCLALKKYEQHIEVANLENVSVTKICSIPLIH